MKAKILFYDIETSPLVGYTWGIWDQNVAKVVRESELLSFAYKFQGQKTIHCKTRADYKDKTDESLVRDLHTLLGSVDIVVAHNGIAFDNKKSFTRFIYHDLEPLHKLATVDTKRVAKNVFAFTSNSLDALAKFLKVGSKMKHSGIDLWDRCMHGEKKAFKEMKAYNKMDVVVLEKVYNRLSKWMPSHPSVALIKGVKDGCPKCGEKALMPRGYYPTEKTLQRRMRCSNCFKWTSKTITKKELDKRNKN